jgi:hypothetical protein
MNTENSSWVFAHGHHGEGLGRRRCLGPWASKAQCHLSPTLSASQQGTGREGEGLLRLVEGKRLDVAWARGSGGAVDLVDLVQRHVARKWRLGGEKDSFKAPDQPLAAAYFSMCFFSGVLADGPYGEAHTVTDLHGLTGMGKMLAVSPRCARKWARRTGFPSLASQVPTRDVRFAKSNLSLPIVGWLAHGVLADCHHAHGHHGNGRGTGRMGGRDLKTARNVPQRPASSRGIFIFLYFEVFAHGHPGEGRGRFDSCRICVAGWIRAGRGGGLKIGV